MKVQFICACLTLYLYLFAAVAANAGNATFVPDRLGDLGDVGTMTDGKHCTREGGVLTCTSDGTPGVPGATGPTGPQGIQGLTGATGPQGIQGNAGAAGAVGATGSTGPAGSAGAAGATGATGLQGDAGIAGADGEDCWDLNGNGTCDAVTEDINLDTFCTVLDCKGETGDAGAAGSAGATGATGPQGIQGDAGAAGAVGSTGATGPQGDAGAAGAAGSTGATGPTGATGTQYPWLGTWSSGTTYATNDCVYYSGSGYVSLQGSNINQNPATQTAYWSILVSKGETGPAGATGAVGATGTAGTNGTTGATGPVGATGPAGSGLTIQEVDTSPTGAVITLNVTNGTLTDNGGGSFTLNTGGGGGSGTVTAGAQYSIPFYSAADGGTTLDDVTGLKTNAAGTLLETVKGTGVDSILLRQGTTGGESTGFKFQASASSTANDFTAILPDADAAEPTAGQVLIFGAPSSHISQMSYGGPYQAPTATLTSFLGLTETAGGIPYGTGDNAYAWLAAGATTEVLVGGGAAAPVWTTATGSGAPVRADSPVFIDDITVHAAGVKITGDGDGAVTLLGLGNGFDEDLTINLDDTENTAGISSSTGVTSINFGAIKLITTGPMQGGMNIIGSFAAPQTQAGAYSLTAANSYGSIIFYDDVEEIDLPAAVAGMNFCVYVANSKVITIDPNSTDVIVRDGTAQTGGVTMTLTGTTGNYVCLLGDAANHWVTMGYKGTLAAGS